MRKIINKSLAVIIAVLIMASLVACSSSNLSGTYKAAGVIQQTVTFSGDSITLSAFGLDITGTYVIDGGNIKITYPILGVETTITKTFSQDENKVIIDGTEFYKQ